MGEYTLENSVAEKYLGDKIQEDDTTASITETLNSRLPIVKAKREEILKTCNDSRLIGVPSAIDEYESKLASKILNIADSWIGVNDRFPKLIYNKGIPSFT